MTIAKLSCCCFSLVVLGGASRERDFFRFDTDPDGSMYMTMEVGDNTTLQVINVMMDPEGPSYKTGLALKVSESGIELLDLDPEAMSVWLGEDGSRTATWHTPGDLEIALEIDCHWNSDGNSFCCGVSGSGSNEFCFYCVFRQPDGTVGGQQKICWAK